MVNPLLTPVRIVLVEPAGPLNVGAIARVMKNMGLSQLVLVNPQCDPLGPEARQMAVHAADVLEAAQIVDTLPQALSSCRKAIATTGRDRSTDDLWLESPRACLPWLIASPQAGQPPPPAALIFGREDRGLTRNELNLAQRFLQIPTDEVYSSLNLAQAVAVCSYELLQAAQATAQQPPLVDGTPPHEAIADVLAPLDSVEQYLADVEALLLHIGYLYPHTANRRMQKLRRLLHRAYPTEPEVALLRGMVRQMRWALTQPTRCTIHNAPTDAPTPPDQDSLP